MIISVDPGISGCLVAMSRSGEILAHLQMPTIKVSTKNRVNGAAVAAWIEGLRKDGHLVEHAYIELVGSMPKESVASGFSFGHSVGTVEGVVIGAMIPYTRVQPGAWKKSAKLVGKDKDAARSRCVQLYPGLRDLDLKGKGQAVSDAILIGRHGLGLEN